MNLQFVGNCLIELLIVWIFGLLGTAIAAGMQLELWLINGGVLGLSF